VAEAAGVSQTTVSFVLNNIESANISQETKDRVWEAAQKLGYVPDVRARSLAGGKSNNIALVLARPHRQVFIDEYIPNIMTGISQYTRDRHYRILVELTEEDGSSVTLNNMIRGNEIAGMIVNFSNPASSFTEQLKTFAEEGFPLVTLDQIHPSVPSVIVDKFAGFRNAVEHLLGLGYRRIACIPYSKATVDQLHIYTRLMVYKEALEQAGIPYDPALVCEGNYDPETGYEAMKTILSRGRPPEALLGMNDVMAIGAMKAIHEAGLRIPEDIAVMGFDDIRLAPFVSPPLSTVRELDVEHGREAVEMLFKLINGEPLEERHIVLHTELKIRESCGATRLR